MHALHPGENIGLVKYALYPLLVVAMFGYAAFELRKPTESFGSDYVYYLLLLVAVVLLAETRHPLRDEWKMTRSSFFAAIYRT